MPNLSLSVNTCVHVVFVMYSGIPQCVHVPRRFNTRRHVALFQPFTLFLLSSASLTPSIFTPSHPPCCLHTCTCPCLHVRMRLLKVDQDWIPSEDGFSLYIRPTAIATSSTLGVSPPHHALFFIITCPVRIFCYACHGIARIYSVCRRVGTCVCIAVKTCDLSTDALNTHSHTRTSRILDARACTCSLACMCAT